ncbi:MAG: 30S ribosomal protein S8 [Candidatus Diapherotrites archaeon]|nr:30S ribosomal protein S8 [Candidatus Diapherotrites archaeon]
MSLVDPLADALVNIKNHESAAKKMCVIYPASRLLGEILRVMHEKGFIEGFERIDDGRQGLYRITLAGKINECKAIKPRYAVKKDGFKKFEKRFLPSRDLGVLIVSTPKGVMAHDQTKEQNIGGRLLAYVY